MIILKISNTQIFVSIFENETRAGKKGILIFLSYSYHFVKEKGKEKTCKEIRQQWKTQSSLLSSSSLFSHSPCHYYYTNLPNSIISNNSINF